MNKRCCVMHTHPKQVISPRKLYCKPDKEVLLQMPSLYLLILPFLVIQEGARHIQNSKGLFIRKEMSVLYQRWRGQKGMMGWKTLSWDTSWPQWGQQKAQVLKIEERVWITRILRFRPSNSWTHTMSTKSLFLSLLPLIPLSPDSWSHITYPVPAEAAPCQPLRKPFWGSHWATAQGPGPVQVLPYGEALHTASQLPAVPGLGTFGSRTSHQAA